VSDGRGSGEWERTSGSGNTRCVREGRKGVGSRFQKRLPTPFLRSFNAGDANLYRYVGNSPTNATDPTGLTIERSEIGDDIGEFLKGNRQHRHIYTTKLGWLDSSHFKMDQIYRTIYNQLKAIHKSGKPGVVTAVYGGTPGTTTMKWDVSPKGERFSLGDPCNGGFADSYLDVVTFGLAYELFVIGEFYQGGGLHSPDWAPNLPILRRVYSPFSIEDLPTNWAGLWVYSKIV